MNNILISTILGVIIAALLWTLLLSGGLKNQERHECATWAERAKEFSETYWLEEWQYKQCEAVDRPLPDGFLKAK